MPARPSERNGTRIRLRNGHVGTHPEGAVIALNLEAQTALDAIAASRSLLEYGIQSIAALAGWTIDSTEILDTPTPAATPQRQNGSHRRRA